MKLTDLVADIRLCENATNGYLAYLVPENARQELAKRFPPKYPDFIGHHITAVFGVRREVLDKYIPEERQANIKVIGYAEEDGLEALVVSVDGIERRPDGKRFHITWSLDKAKGKKPVMSNNLIAQKGYVAVEPYEFQSELGFFSF